MTDLLGQYLGRYLLTERLGQGGMAVVYKGFDTRLKRDVAVKIIRETAFSAEAWNQILERFEREAVLLAKLSHPNIVKVLDYGEKDGSPYLIMEYLPGGTLKESLGNPIPWRDAVTLILPIARSVAYAHRQGILHRDIKPANILFTDDGDSMLSDFGIAKLYESEQTATLTGSGIAVGTPGYMAPEQWTGKAGPQSDLYSLGIVLYEMLTGCKPYVADTPAEIMLKQATEPLPSPRQFVKKLPWSLESFLIKTLEKEPKNRYKDLYEFISTLEKVLSSKSVVTTFPEENARLKAEENARQKNARRKEEKVANKKERLDAEERARKERAERRAAQIAARKASIFKFFAAFKSNFPKVIPPLRIASFAGIVIILFWFGSWGFPKLAALIPTSKPSSTPTLRPSATVTFTISPIPPTKTRLIPTSTKTRIPSSTPPALRIGSNIESDKDYMLMLYVPAGEFTMGSENGKSDEKPVHTVYVDAFWIDLKEITNGQYEICVEAGQCKPPRFTNSLWRTYYYGVQTGYGSYPVIYVSWNDANKYCSWAGRRLPTEAEWEKAASWNDKEKVKYIYPSGDSIDCSAANFAGCVGNTDATNSSFNGSTNRQGTYHVADMAGNVWEWVSSLYQPYPYSPTDGREDLSVSGNRVFRGGSYNDAAISVRSTIRANNDPSYISNAIGFRCAMDAP